MLTICVMLYLMHFLANSWRILVATNFLLFRVGYECSLYIWELASLWNESCLVQPMDLISH